MVPTNLDTPPVGNKPLGALLIAQFFGAFNDNAWKIAVAQLAMLSAMAGTDARHAAPDAANQKATAICFVVFTLPMMLFSLPAGLLADRVSKRSVIVWMKVAEVALMAVGALALYLSPSAWLAPLILLGLMGFQSALFSPAKYGILPEILNHESLSKGNGLLEMWTFIAIVTGTAAGGLLMDLAGDHRWAIGAALTGLSLVGLLASLGIPRVPPARSEGGLADTVKSALSIMKSDRVLWLAVLGAAYYWGIASLIGQNVFIYAKSLTAGWAHEETFSAVPLGLLGVGVGAGSVLAGRLSGQKIEYGLIPLGALGMTPLILLMGLWAPGLPGTIVLLMLLGVCSGLVVVPLNAVLQWRSPPDRRGAVIALANVLTLAGVLVGSITGFVLAAYGFDARRIFIAGGILVLAGTLWAITLLPDVLLRLVLILLTHSVYRLKISGRPNVPDHGGALLVPNHVSFVDGLLILASLDRPVRFLVDSSCFEKWWLQPFMKSLGAIPISASGGLRGVLKALRQAGQYLDEGQVVCLFPEGQITRIGALLPFRRGLEKIVKGRSAPIIPVYLDQLWGSVFSFKGGRFVTKWPQKIPYPVSVSFGPPLPPDTPAWMIRQAVQDLSTQSWMARIPNRRPLHHTFIHAVRRGPRRFAFADETSPNVSALKALTGAIVIARTLRPRWANQDRVGILLPPSVVGALVNIAAAISGRTSVNLNYTAGKAAMTAALKQAKLTTVITSRAFLEKAKLALPEGLHPVFVEDLKRRQSSASRITAMLLALVAPPRLIERICGAHKHPDMDSELTIIFSSGSTGQPKGVVLTHANIDSNVEALAQVFPVRRSDKMLGILPMFHSFGFMTLWLAANHGVGVVFHYNPLDAEAVGRLVETHRITILVATPTFLQLYLRRCSPGSFGSLRIVFTGAEKLPTRLVEGFEQTFGIRPIEGYGTTECSPAVAVSTLDVRYGGIYQSGSRRGSVGLPLPGVSIRVVDPDTFEPLEINQPGLLLVKGPNVMRGYLGQDDLTAKVMRDGWYVTGDMAAIDEDGFIRITDRLSRFSKIGGEMVPHGRVEEALQEAAGLDLQAFAVTAIPDEKKGERLAVLHTYEPNKIPQLIEKLTQMGLPNLFIPRADHFVKVDALPILGTGKLDLREVKRRALESLASNAPQQKQPS